MALSSVLAARRHLAVCVATCEAGHPCFARELSALPARTQRPNDSSLDSQARASDHRSSGLSNSFVGLLEAHPRQFQA